MDIFLFTKHSVMNFFVNLQVCLCDSPLKRPRTLTNFTLGLKGDFEASVRDVYLRCKEKLRLFLFCF